MKYPTIKKAGAVLALLLSTTSGHAYNQNSAKNACINKVTQYGSGQYYNATNLCCGKFLIVLWKHKIETVCDVLLKIRDKPNVWGQ